MLEEGIRLEHVSKAFGEKQVLKDLSCVFPYGGNTAIMGPSGCGKTTLLRLISRLERPDAGRITGVPDRIGTVFQEERLVGDLTVMRNLLLAVPGKKGEARSLLRALGLSGEEHTPVRTLSGGMQRRVAIARALLYDAPLLIMDEPLKGLDEETRSRTIALIREKTRGKTVILVTHDPRDAKDMDALPYTMGN